MPVIEELHDFEMDNNLLLSMMQRQAGSLHKACLEGAMNAVEAKSTAVNFRFKPDSDLSVGEHGQLLISDDGKGIDCEDHVARWFKRFGTEHDSTEQKIWAEFRMGRGQLFAFGVNTWRTATFEFVVDLKNVLRQHNLATHFPLCFISHNYS